MPDPRTALFQRIADHYPVQAIERGGAGRALWKMLFYALGPRRPFVMHARHYRLWVDPAKRKDIARTILHRGNYEPIETAVMLAHLRPGMTVIDAGANIGHYAMVAAAAVGPTGCVAAFEPDPDNHAALAANIALNGLHWAQAERLALGAAEGEAVLHRDDANRGGHSLAAANVQRAGGLERVALTTLDAYAAAKLAGRRIGFIKIDVQGAEAAVLAGAGKVLARDRPVLLMEYWPAGLRGFGADPLRLVRQILEMDYDLSVIEADHPGHVRRLAGIDELARIDLSHAQAYANLVFIPAENAGR